MRDNAVLLRSSPCPFLPNSFASTNPHHDGPSIPLSLVVGLLGRLALVHAAQELGLVVLDGLVDLGAARRLVAVHAGGQRRVGLGGELLGRLLLAAAAGGVVLVARGLEAVGDAALVLFFYFFRLG